MKRFLNFIDKHFLLAVLLFPIVCITAIATIGIIQSARENTILDVIDTAIVIKVAAEKQLDYHFVATSYEKQVDDIRYYHTDYIGCDEFHTYYSVEYLTATRNYEILQIVEVAKYEKENTKNYY